MNNIIKSNLIIVTGSYPYDMAKEDTFLSLEIKILCNFFDNITIIPEKLSGYKCKIPNKIIVIEDYARKYKDGTFNRFCLVFNAIFLKYTWSELAKNPIILISPSMISRLLYMAGNARRMRIFISKFISDNNINLDKTLFYTYWLGSSSVAIGSLKYDNYNVKLVSRAHGHDLYAYRHYKDYIPFQRLNLKQLNRLFVISEHGKRYLKSKYSMDAEICTVSRLGVDAPGFISRASADGVFRIFSCSFIVDVKRLDLLYDGLKCLAELKPDEIFEWYHIGDGPLMDDLRSRTLNSPKNLRVTLTGFLTNRQVLKFYQDMPCDVFVNTSSSEGIPVSIMEAISCGIPIVATAVGGNPEIACERNGALLSANPSPEEISNTIWELLRDRYMVGSKRKASIEIWEKFYNADKNYARYANELRRIMTI